MTQAKKDSNAAYILRLGFTLFLICALTAGLLGLVNAVTKDKILAAADQKTAEAMAAVMPGAAFTEAADFVDGTGLVTAAYRADRGGAVVRVAPAGFGGVIDLLVGVDGDGKVTGVAVVKLSETPGLGANAAKSGFLGQFTGGEGEFALSRDGGGIDALTGATITSAAVVSGVNAAVACAKTLS